MFPEQDEEGDFVVKLAKLVSAAACSLLVSSNPESTTEIKWVAMYFTPGCFFNIPFTYAYSETGISI